MSSVSFSHSLNDTFQFYGFKTLEQKEALKNLFKSSGVIQIDTTWQENFPIRHSQSELMKDILKIVELTQNKFCIRKGFQERWEISPLAWMQSNKDAHLFNLKTLGFIDAINSNLKQVDAICLLGGMKVRMDDRIQYANLLIKSGLQAKAVILLTGERYVTENIDGTAEQLSKIAKNFNIEDWRQLTETHLIQESYNKSDLSKLGLITYIIDTPKRHLPRPTTQTTTVDLAKWLQSHEDIRSIVFISNQPYIKYQKAIIDTIFYDKRVNISYEVVGPAAQINTIQSILEGLGSYIWAATPMALTKMNLKINNLQIKKAFKKLYSSNPLIYDTLPKNLK